MLRELAEAAYAAGLAAEGASTPQEAEALHSVAARRYVETAKRVSDPVTRRAVALVGEAHAQRAQRASRGDPSPPKALLLSPTPPPLSSSSEEKQRRERRDSSNGALCVGDLLALERRLHALGAKGLSKAVTAKKTQSLRAAYTMSSQDLVVQYLGDDDDDDDGGRGKKITERDSSDETHHHREECLARALKKLSDENAILRKKIDALEKREANCSVAEKNVEKFKDTYQKKFDSLKVALDDFRRRHPAAQNPANALEQNVVDPEPPKSYFDLEKQLKSLTEQLKAEKEFSRKKDAVIEKYEHWYRALKDSANKRKATTTSTSSNNNTSGVATTASSSGTAGGAAYNTSPSSSETAAGGSSSSFTGSKATSTASSAPPKAHNNNMDPSSSSSGHR